MWKSSSATKAGTPTQHCGALSSLVLQIKDWSYPPLQPHLLSFCWELVVKPYWVTASLNTSISSVKWVTVMPVLWGYQYSLMINTSEVLRKRNSKHLEMLGVLSFVFLARCLACSRHLIPVDWVNEWMEWMNASSHSLLLLLPQTRFLPRIPFHLLHAWTVSACPLKLSSGVFSTGKPDPNLSVRLTLNTVACWCVSPH